jgi:hypothetical protein
MLCHSGDSEKRSTIELGSFNDKESLLVKATIGIDKNFKGKPFSKPDVYSLGKDIEGIILNYKQESTSVENY